MLNKKLLVVCLAAGAFLLPSIAGAAVDGPCVACHTMHDSQGGTAVTAGAAGPYDYLLAGSGCTGCHAYTTNVAATGKALNAPKAPQVDDGTNTNAAGYFSYGDNTAATHELGHQVNDFTGVTADATISASSAVSPGGAFTTGATGAAPTMGCSSCHSRSAHHSAPANTYRMLDEDFDLTDQLVSATYGVLADATRGIGATGDGQYDATAMNLFCANCHGTYHDIATNQQGSAAGIWKRHPTDIQVVTAAGATILTAMTIGTDSHEVTVGLASTVDGFIMCITCHNAHGSSYPDLLKYNSTANQANDSTSTVGCESCHEISAGNGM